MAKKKPTEMWWSPEKGAWLHHLAPSGQPEPYSETFPVSGTIRSGRLSQPLPSEPPINVKGYLYSQPAETNLPTPQAVDTGEPQTREARAARGYGPDLKDVVVHEVPNLPTPRATDGTKGGPNQRGSSGDQMLPSAVVSLLPTPVVTDAKGARNSTASRRDPDKANPGDTLTDALWRVEEANGHFTVPEGPMRGGRSA